MAAAQLAGEYPHIDAPLNGGYQSRHNQQQFETNSSVSIPNSSAGMMYNSQIGAPSYMLAMHKDKKDEDFCKCIQENFIEGYFFSKDIMNNHNFFIETGRRIIHHPNGKISTYAGLDEIRSSFATNPYSNVSNYKTSFDISTFCYTIFLSGICTYEGVSHNIASHFILHPVCESPDFSDEQKHLTAMDITIITPLSGNRENTVQTAPKTFTFTANNRSSASRPSKKTMIAREATPQNPKITKEPKHIEKENIEPYKQEEHDYASSIIAEPVENLPSEASSEAIKSSGAKVVERAVEPLKQDRKVTANYTTVPHTYASLVGGTTRESTRSQNEYIDNIMNYKKKQIPANTEGGDEEKTKTFDETRRPRRDRDSVRSPRKTSNRSSNNFREKNSAPIEWDPLGLYITNLPDKIERTEIEENFKKFGEITNIKMPSTQADRMKYVHVIYKNKEDVEEVINQQPEIRIKGMTLKIDRKRNYPSRTNSSNNRPRNFNKPRENNLRSSSNRAPAAAGEEADTWAGLNN